MSLRIYTLGPFRVHRSDSPIPDPAWKTQKNKALLKILLTYRRRALTKEQLMEWLWPHLDPDAAGRNLRVAVSQLRRALEPDLPRGSQSSFILTTDAGYAWNTQADYWLDAEEFERLAGNQWQMADGSPHQDAISHQPSVISHQLSAIGLYQGDYLEEDRYADWATAERERLRELYFTLLTRLAEAYARQGRYRRAVATCREVLAADRCRESVWCQLMLYHYHAGDQALALRAYEDCQQILAEELGVEPLPATTALAGKIRRREVASQRPYPPPAAIEGLRQLPLSLGRTPFVGRETEYAWLVDHLERTAAGQGRVVVIEGEAGVGKTRLAEEILGYAQQRGATILEGRCREESGQPYQPIIEALRTTLRQGDRGTKRQGDFSPSPPLPLPVSSVWLGAVAELLPEPRQLYPELPDIPPLPPEQEKARLLEALTQLLLTLRTTDATEVQIDESVHPANPLLFFLDDLHWADAATLEFLGYFAARLMHEPVLVLGTFRSEEVAADDEDALTRLLWALHRQSVLHRLVLGPLSSEAVIHLLQEISGLLPEQGSLLGQRLYQETEGNPLFLVSLLQALFEDGLLTADETGVWSARIPDVLRRDTAVMPPTMQEVILHRLGRLGVEERKVLEAAAVLGREFQWPALGQMRVWRRDVLFDHLDHLVGALLIRERGHESYIFSHDKIRQAIYEGVAEERRGWLHGKAGEALETVHADGLDEVAGTLAHHFQQAGRLDRAFAYRLRAGWHAVRLYANAEAMDHYQAALALVGQAGLRPTAGALREAHERLADLYQSAGQYAPARDHFETARHHATAPADRVRLLYKLAHSHDREGHAGPSRELLRRAVGEVDRLGVDQVGYLEAARVYARWAIMGSTEHSQSDAEHYAGLAVSILQQHFPEVLHGEVTLPWAEYDTVHSVLINAGETFRHWGRWSDAADLFRESLVVAERHEDLNGIGYSCNNWGDVCLAQGDFPGARALYEQAIESWAASGHTWLEMAARTHLGLAWAREGRWEEAATCLEGARGIGEGIDPTQWLGEVYLWLSLAELHRTGDEDQAQAYRERAVAVADVAGQVLPEALWHLALSVAEAHAGRLGSAWEHYSQVQALWKEKWGNVAIYWWILQRCEPPALLEDQG